MESTAAVSSEVQAAAARAAWMDDPAAREALERITRRNPNAAPLERLPDVHPGKLPRHIAIIMDGNGRWANERGFPRMFGHRAGAAAVRETVSECGKLGVEVLTLYSFSLENWRRPKEEVEALMQLCVLYLEGEVAELCRHNVRFKVIGRREGLPGPVVEAIARTEEATAKNTAATLCLAINYGSRAEIADAARAIARDVAAGRLKAEDVDEVAVEQRLYTAGLPDPDLLIRTAGELRVSNYLLWQISYAELYVTPTYWPDFGAAELHRAVRAYAGRERRFGALGGGTKGAGAGTGETAADAR